MDTKLKVKRNFGFKILAFLVSLAGLMAIVVGIANYRTVMAFVDREAYVFAEYFADRYEFQLAVNDTYIDEKGNLRDLAAERAEGSESLIKYYEKGYRFAVFLTNNEAFDNGVRNSAVSAEEFIKTINIDSLQSWDRSDGTDNTVKTFYCGISNEAFNAALDAAAVPAQTGRMLFYLIIAGILLFIGGLIWIGVFAGRVPKEDDLKLRFFHKIYNDVAFFCYFWAAFGLIYAFYVVWDPVLNHYNYASPNYNEEVIWTVTIAVAVLLTFFTAWIVANFSVHGKRHELLKHTAIYKLFAWICRGIVRIARAIARPFKAVVNRNIKNKIIACGAGFLVVMWIYSMIAFAMAELYNMGTLFIYFLFAAPIITAVLVAAALKFFAEFTVIRNGASEIRNGNPTHKIPPCKNKEFNQIAEDINNLGEGLENAVKDALVSERMKTELITNVSHDLKTPLTSIVSYVDLLEKEELSEEARDYVAVLKSKAERLKAIISDLFDLSKSSSGNIDLVVEKLDLSKLIQQTLADMEDRISASGLVMKTALPDGEVAINSDGKKLYRALQNVIDNALKYSLSGTRIFISLTIDSGRALVKIQNTAGYEMDFSEQEILERFSRGDKSRGTEGTGLGLSIAESFTKVCGGSFRIKIDGDQFKVYIELPVMR